MTLRARSGLPSFRTQVVRRLFREVLERQSKRGYAKQFRVAHFSIQDDHIHLIVEATIDSGEPSNGARADRHRAERDLLRKGVSGLSISFARRLNAVLRRAGKVWGDRHHRRDLESPTDVRNTILYVLQNWLRHGMKTFGRGVVDPYSSALRFEGWANEHATIVDPEVWPDASPRTWLLRIGWTRAGGLLRTSDVPPAAKSVRHAPIVAHYRPSSGTQR